MDLATVQKAGFKRLVKFSLGTPQETRQADNALRMVQQQSMFRAICPPTFLQAKQLMILSHAEQDARHNSRHTRSIPEEHVQRVQQCAQCVVGHAMSPPFKTDKTYYLGFRFHEDMATVMQ